MLAQVDANGHSTTLFDSIIDYHKSPNAVDKIDKFVITPRGNRKLRKTTLGWKLLVAWKDGSESWVPLKDMKESNPVEVADFSIANSI